MDRFHFPHARTPPTALVTVEGEPSPIGSVSISVGPSRGAVEQVIN